jgi:cytochrome c551/c552
MDQSSWKKLLIEGWWFILAAVIGLAVGFVIGDFAASPKTETVLAPASAQKEAGATEGGSQPTEGQGESGGSATEETAQLEGGAQVFASNGCGSCHALAAANSTGAVGPNLNEYLAPDDDRAGIEEMIVDPNSEIAEGFTANVMPQTYGQSLSKGQLDELVQFLIENTPAGGKKPEGPGGEENDVGGPSN